MNYQSTTNPAHVPVRAPNVTDTTLATFIWKNAEDLWGDKVAFVNHIGDIAREDANTMAQIANNSREVAMSGNIKGAVQSAVVRAMTSHADLAEHVMKHDQLAMGPLVDLVYELIKSRANIDASMAGA